jgi:hypothetical protein
VDKKYARRVTWQPGQPLPKRANRPTLAVILTANGYPTHSPRAFERWPLTTWTFHGKEAVHDVEEALAVAEKKLGAPYRKNGS